MSEARPPRLRTWLQLLRAPNLFTVPGDPLAGYLLASFSDLGAGLFYAMGASLCFYGGGLLLNDLADLEEDRAERPARPLPSGAAKLASVRVAMAAIFVAGLALCIPAGAWTLGVGVALTCAIAAYNLYSKRLIGLGALNMGICRGLNLLLGATAVAHGDLTVPLLLHGRLEALGVAIIAVIFYIAAVTHLARFETRAAVPPSARWLPPLVIVGAMLCFLPLVSGPTRTGSAALFCVSIFVASQAAWKSARRPELPLPPVIGQFIRLLLPLQAAFCAATGEIFGSASAALLVVLWPLSRWAGRRFYAS